MRQHPPFSFAPQLEQGRREERERTGLSLDVCDERVDKLALHAETGLVGRPFDRPRELVSLHRAEQDVVRAQQGREFVVRSTTAIEVSTERDNDDIPRSEEHTSELQSLRHLVCRLLLEKKKK